MPRVIGSDCIGCGTCAGECPVDAISPDGDVYTIDEDTCIDCGACEEVCPVSTITEK